MLGPQLLPTGIDDLDNHIEYAHESGHNSQVKAGHADVDHGGLAVVIEVVEEDEHFDRDDADVVDEPDDDLHLALVGAGNHQVELEGEVQAVEDNEQVDLDEAWEDAKQAQGKQ